MGNRLAVILFNLGGPDAPGAVQPFLFNLFSDPAILNLPRILRWPLAKFISARRAPIAATIYAKIGGRSPIVPETKRQAAAVEARLNERGWDEARCFVTMRYWTPRAAEMVQEVMAYGPDQIVLLPLYPQFSATTSGSSLKEWRAAAEKIGLTAPTATVCCHPLERSFIVAHAELIRERLASVPNPRLLFSAHGLPQRVVDGGDPYQWQVEQTAQKVVDELGISDLDWSICYQSRVGPLKWIGPSTEDEIKRAGGDGKALVLTPIAFVSEHSETLVELDIEYKELAESCGVPSYIRVAALGTAPGYMDALAEVALAAAARGHGTAPGKGTSARLCSANWTGCPNAAPKSTTGEHHVG